MKNKRALQAMLSAVILCVDCAWGQTNATGAATVPATNTPPTRPTEPDERAWSFSVSLAGYLVQGSHDYAQPTLSADRDWLHLEARYNYEALETGSAWMGYNFSVGDKVTLDFTPMLGGVFGDLNGVAPGYEFTLSWWKLELYSEAEYVFDLGDSSGKFFYTWSELSLAPVDWLRFGFVVQRTKSYQTELDVQRGLLVGFNDQKVDFTTYLFNPDQDKPTVVLAVGVTF